MGRFNTWPAGMHELKSITTDGFAVLDDRKRGPALGEQDRCRFKRDAHMKINSRGEYSPRSDRPLL
jgi:hypothetical protein